MFQSGVFGFGLLKTVLGLIQLVDATWNDDQTFSSWLLDKNPLIGAEVMRLF